MKSLQAAFGFVVFLIIVFMVSSSGLMSAGGAKATQVHDDALVRTEGMLVKSLKEVKRVKEELRKVKEINKKNSQAHKAVKQRLETELQKGSKESANTKEVLAKAAAAVRKAESMAKEKIAEALKNNNNNNNNGAARAAQSRDDNRVCNWPLISNHDIDEFHRQYKINRKPMYRLYMRDRDLREKYFEENKLLQSGAEGTAKCVPGKDFVIGNTTWVSERKTCEDDGHFDLPAGYYAVGEGETGYAYQPPVVAPTPFKTSTSPSIVVLMMDAMSQPQYQRTMFLTERILQRRAISDDSRLFNVMRYGSMGGSSRQNKLPMMTGNPIDHFTVHQVQRGGRFVDTYDRWIWGEMEKRGYTSAEASVYCPEAVGKIEFPKLDISHFNIHHYQHFFPKTGKYPFKHTFPQRSICSSTFEAASTSRCCFTDASEETCAAVRDYLIYYETTSPKCMAGEWTSLTALRWLDSLRKASDKPVFAYIDFWDWHITRPKSGYTLDEIWAQVISELDFKNTIVLFMSDHGNQERYATSQSGHNEHKMPFFKMMVPRAWINKYPERANILQANFDNELIVPLDLYHTLLHMTDMESPYKPDPLTDNRGQSLFYKLPEKRNCREAAIPDDSCLCEENYHPCRGARESGYSDEAIVEVLNHMNKILSKSKVCRHPVALKERKDTFFRESGTYGYNFRYLFTIDSEEEMLFEATAGYYNRTDGYIIEIFNVRQMTHFSEQVAPCREAVRNEGGDLHLCDCMLK